MSDGTNNNSGWNSYIPPAPSWTPWVPSSERNKPSSMSTSDIAKLYLNDATNRSGYNDPFSNISAFGSTIQWDMENGYFIWAGNSQPNPIAFFSDQTINADGSVTSTGKPLGSTLAGIQGISQGSPAELNEFIGTITKQYRGREMELKQLLQQKNYLQGEYAARSLAFGNAPDPYFQEALKLAALDGTVVNLGRINAGEKKLLSFTEWLKNTQKAPGSSAFGPGGGGTTTRIIHQKFDPADYDIAIDQLFQQTVGRGASKEELDFFVGQLQSYSDANPQKVVTTTSGNTTTTTTTGGVSGERAASMMREQALANPNAEGYNKATKYLDYFMNALSSPIRLG